VPILSPKSAVEGLSWPGLPEERGATLLALQFQLEQSQWWPPEALLGQQLRQLDQLLAHSIRNVPFYSTRIGAAGFAPKTPLTPEIWARIPLLRREDIQRAGKDLRSRRLPESHGRASELTTSGSTGKPVTVVRAQLAKRIYSAITLRSYAWYQRDLSRKSAAIRAVGGGKASYPEGLRQPNWGPVTDSVFATGPSVVLELATSIEKQAEWLQRENPEYLITLPTNLLELVDHCAAHGIAVPKLRNVMTLGGVLFPEVRAQCRRTWGVPVIDTYSAQEVGHIALQCPDHEHYHVQAESALVEVVDDQGRPCAPGAWGRVVVTPLHNFAMPLIRYDIGDLAEVGGPCPCGRGLPVLEHILGRVRNMLTLPTGERVSPGFVNDWFEGFPVSQFQIVQRALDHLEVKIVPLRPFTEAEEERVRALLRLRLDSPFRVTISYHEQIPRSADGKYEDFVSELDAQAAPE
jgi:phenylacetate-CoA ligase